MARSMIASRAPKGRECKQAPVNEQKLLDQYTKSLNLLLGSRTPPQAFLFRTNVRSKRIKAPCTGRELLSPSSPPVHDVHLPLPRLCSASPTSDSAAETSSPGLSDFTVAESPAQRLCSDFKSTSHVADSPSQHSSSLLTNSARRQSPTPCRAEPYRARSFILQSFTQSYLSNWIYRIAAVKNTL